MIPEIKALNLVDIIGRYTHLRKVAAHEWAGPCPRCGGRDRFHVSDLHGFFCRTCQGEPGSTGHWGDAADFIQFAFGVTLPEALRRLGIDRKATPAELEQLGQSREQADNERRIKESTQQALVHDQLTRVPDWRNYAEYLKDDATRELWHKRGLSDEWIEYYAVGYCPSRNFASDGGTFESASLTIPYFRPVWKSPAEFDHYRCVGLQHRLLCDAPMGGKYRPHLPGAGKQLFWADILVPRIHKDVLIVEGEIKAMVVNASLWIGEDVMAPHLAVVGVPGKGWKEEWISEFQKAERAWVCLDPDATDSARKLAAAIGPQARVVLLPDKIDDLITGGILDGAGLLKLLTEAAK